MRVLNDITRSWRNFFFANRDNYLYEPKNFLISLELIRDSRNDILCAVMNDDPEKDTIIKESKEEIAFQREDIKIMVKAFMDFTNVDKSTFVEEALIDYLINDNTESDFYIVIDEWKEWGQKAHRIWDRLNDRYGHGIGYTHDDLCELIMDEVYNQHNDEK